MTKNLKEQIKIIEAGEVVPGATGLFGMDVSLEEASLVLTSSALGCNCFLWPRNI